MQMVNISLVTSPKLMLSALKNGMQAIRMESPIGLRQKFVIGEEKTNALGMNGVIHAQWI